MFVQGNAQPTADATEPRLAEVPEGMDEEKLNVQVVADYSSDDSDGSSVSDISEVHTSDSVSESSTSVDDSTDEETGFASDPIITTADVMEAIQQMDEYEDLEEWLDYVEFGELTFAFGH